MASELPFIDPTRGATRGQHARAPRPIDLHGKVIGLLDNTKEQADIILETLGEELRRRYGAARVVLHRKEFFSRPAQPALLDVIAKEVDVAIAAVGG